MSNYETGLDLFKQLSDAVKNNSMFNVVAQAHKTLALNKECFIAQYFIKNPDVNPKDLMIVYRPSLKYIGTEFSVELKDEQL